MLKPGTQLDGYKYVILNKNGARTAQRVRRLVACAFLKNPNNLPIVNHKDEKRDDNRADNLEWCDFSYNATYNNAHLKRGVKLGQPVYVYDKQGDFINIYTSVRDFARQFNTSAGSANAACDSPYRTCCGFILSRAELTKDEVLSRVDLNERRCKKITEAPWGNKPRKVLQYDLDGHFIASFPSTQEAGRQVGMSSSQISGVCRGQYSHAHGFVFEYAN